MIASSDRPSPRRALDPRLKIAWCVAVSLLAVVLGSPMHLAGLLALTLVPWFWVRPPLARVRALAVMAALVVLGTMVSQGFFYGLEPRTELLSILPGLSLCREGLFYGAVASCRLLAVLSAGMLVMLTTHASDLILALAKLGVPGWFAFMLTLALRFLPETVEQAKRILVAQQMRGVGGRGPVAAVRRFRLLIVPLVAASLRSARQVALAAEVRAFTFRRFKVLELATAAMLICLLQVATLPWHIGLAKVPGLDAMAYSIPYTAMLLVGLRLLPRPGACTLLLFGQGLLGQWLGSGLNPVWWPYYLGPAAAVEVYLLVAGRSLRSLPAMLGAGLLRGLIAYSTMYFILIPYLWRQFYAWWYIGLKLGLGAAGCAIGAWIAWRLAPVIQRTARHAAP